MRLQFEFATVGDVFEQSFKLVLLSVAVAIVNYLIGDESGIVVILSLGIFLLSQFIRLLGLVSRYKVALEEIESALPSLEVGREEIESVDKLVDYIDDSLDGIEDKHKADLEAVKAEYEKKIQQLESTMKNLESELEANQHDLEEAKRLLKKSWKEKTDLDNSRVGEIQRLKAELASERERVNNLEKQKGQLMNAMSKYKELDVFMSGDNEAIKAKYLSIIASNNAKQRNKEQ